MGYVLRVSTGLSFQVGRPHQHVPELINGDAVSLTEAVVCGVSPSLGFCLEGFELNHNARVLSRDLRERGHFARGWTPWMFAAHLAAANNVPSRFTACCFSVSN